MICLIEVFNDLYFVLIWIKLLKPFFLKKIHLLLIIIKTCHMDREFMSAKSRYIYLKHISSCMYDTLSISCI